MQACAAQSQVSDRDAPAGLPRLPGRVERKTGINDSSAEAKALVCLLKGLPAKISLFPFNPWPGSAYECSDWKTIERFSEIVLNAGYASPVRTPRARDILAACGQLKSRSEKMRARARMLLEESLVVGQD